MDLQIVSNITRLTHVRFSYMKQSIRGINISNDIDAGEREVITDSELDAVLVLY